MSRRRWPWSELGIDETEDISAIRRAYAAKLKVGDYETDAEAFARLRGARDDALWRAENPGYDEDAYWTETDEHEDEAPAPEPFADPVLLKASPLDDDHAFAPPPPESELDRRLDSLHAALNAEREGWPSADDYAAMCADLDAILTAPELEAVETHAQVEGWVADMLSSAIPVSDPLLAPAADALGWRARAGELDLFYAIDDVLQRLAALDFAQAVARPDHKYHRAWRELTREGDAGRPWFGRKRVHELLALIRRDYPTLETSLVPWRVELWSNAREPTVSWWTWLLAAWLIFQVLRFCVDMSETPQNLTAPAMNADRMLLSANEDIEAAFQRIAGPEASGDTLRRANPILHAELLKRWAAAKTSGDTFEAFDQSAFTLFNDALRGAFHTLPYEVAVDWQRLKRERALYHRNRERSDEACVTVLMGSKSFPLPAEMEKKLIELQGRILLARAGYEANAPPHRLDVPGSVVAKAAANAKLSPEHWRDAMEGKRSVADRCNARIGMIDAALAAPRETGLKLLRAM